METIIGLLFILLPVILKLIGKRLEQSGKTANAEKMRRIAQSLNVDDEEDDEEDPLSEWDGDDEENEPVEESVVEIVREPVPPVRKPKAPVLLEEDKKAEKEKIDPKKLVIYSEIMQPKYKDN